MKEKIYNLLAAGALTASGLLVSCNNYDDLNTNPDATTQVPSSMLATGLILSTVQPDYSPSFFHPHMLMKSIAWTEQALDIQYNKLERGSFGSYTSLTSGIKMVEEGDADNVDAYQALYKFMKAYKIFNMSMEMGDVPYSDALEGESGNVTPRYDSQQEVVAQTLADLEEAYTLFGKAKNFGGDPVYGGDVAKWQRACASFELRVLMYCSRRADDTPELRIKERFANVAKNCNLLTDNSDNLQLVFRDKQGERYPIYNEDFKWYMYPLVGDMIIDRMKATGDVRLFYYAEPASAMIEAGMSESDFDAYVSVSASDPFITITQSFSDGMACEINRRYKYDAAGEPYITIGYADQCFILAEGAQRGWISDNAEALYKKGIEASMRFLADNTAEEYTHGRTIDDAVIAAFLAEPAIQLSFGDALEKILTQRYLASFLQDPETSYFNYRRTGYPVIDINESTTLNEVPSQLPLRWRYPESEVSYNQANLEAAVARQFGGTDSNNAQMWIIK